MKIVDSSRRAFFLKGGAAVGAGVAAGAAASVVLSRISPPEAGPVTVDLQLIRELHQSYTRLIEQREFEAAVALFDEHAELALSGETARGRSEIDRLFTNGYRNQQVAALHDAYRPNALQQQDSITLGEDGRHAQATWHVDVAVGVPLQGEHTAAQMARLQGNLGERRWVTGRLEAAYVKNGTQWKMTTLRYRSS